MTFIISRNPEEMKYRWQRPR